MRHFRLSNQHISTACSCKKAARQIQFSSGLLFVPRVETNIGNGTSLFAAPSLWNSLLVYGLLVLVQLETIQFYCHLNTYF